MATRSFAAPTPRAAAPVSRAPVAAPRAAAIAAAKPASGVPRFAVARVTAPAPATATGATPAPERTTAKRDTSPSLSARRAPPAAPRHTSFVRNIVDPRARVSRPESPWEREAGNLSTRPPPRAEATPRPTRADAPGAGLSPSSAHPGLGPSPPSPDGTTPHLLPSSLRRRLEAITGFDLSGIRVITGPSAERAAAALQARAFTQHGRIHLGPTATLSDATLLTHEVAHALQQTLPAEQLSRLGLSPAPPELILRQPFSGSPFADRRRARDALFDPFSLPNLRMGDGVRRALHWIGDDGLAIKVTMAVPEALRPTLLPMQSLANIWSTVQREIDGFPERERLWAKVHALAAATDDPSLIAAARDVAAQLPSFLGLRWAQLKVAIELTERQAKLSAGAWMGGLTSLTPRVAAVLDDLEADLVGTMVDFSEESWARDALRTALGCPRNLTNAYDVLNWVQGLHRSADEMIQVLGHNADFLRTGQYDTSGLTRLASLQPNAQALADGLNAVARIMEQPDGLTTEYEKLATLLPPARQEIATIDAALGPPTQMMTYAFNDLGFIMKSWGGAPVLETFFPNEFTWMVRVGATLDPWISQQEPPLLTTAQESLGGIDHWSGLLAETAAEAKTLDQPVPDYDSGGFINWFRKAWAWLRSKKEKIIKRLLAEVPLLRELMEKAPELWAKAKALFAHFTERIFKEGKILAPLWEFFLGVLELALPNAAQFVRDIANRAGSVLGKILKHPIQFLINLGKGIGTGLVNFGRNIGNHLLKGLLDWLLGEFDLQPPPTMGKILGGLMNLIGFSLRTVSERIAEYLKSKRRPITPAQVEAKLQRAIQIGATGLRWLGHLIRGEFAEFWQDVKQHLNRLWEWVVDRAIHYAVDQLKKHLPPKLAKLVDPTGIMALFTAIQTLYDAIQTAIRYAQQMLAMVREVFRAVREIAEGQIDRAAAFVESAAANVLSVALGFLARFAGLDAIVDEFKKFLNQIREFVVKGIDALVNATGDFWVRIYDAAEEAKNWLKNKRGFTDADGAKRKLYFEEKGANAVLQVTEPEGSISAQAKKLQTLSAFLADFKPANDDEAAILAEITRHADDIDVIKDTGSISAARGEEIYIRFNEVVRLLNELGPRHATPPATQVTWTPINIYGDAHGKKMIAHPLSIDPGDNIGSKPVSTDTRLWSQVKGYQRGGDTAYIKGHLLNHHLHGPGIWTNMIPIARTTNSEMERLAEGKVKEAVVDQNKFVHYEVNMVFGQHSKTPRTNAEGELPSEIKVYAEELKYQRGKWVVNGNKIVSKTLTNDIR